MKTFLKMTAWCALTIWGLHNLFSETAWIEVIGAPMFMIGMTGWIKEVLLKDKV